MPKYTDQINSANPKDVAQSAYSLVDVLQVQPAHIQVLGPAALFLAICNHSKVNPNEALTVVSRISTDPIHGQRPEFKALDLYIKGELRL